MWANKELGIGVVGRWGQLYEGAGRYFCYYLTLLSSDLSYQNHKRQATSDTGPVSFEVVRETEIGARLIRGCEK